MKDGRRMIQGMLEMEVIRMGDDFRYWMMNAAIERTKLYVF